MNHCKSCNCEVQRCLHFPKGKKCCPDCKCSLIDKGIEEYNNSISDLYSATPDDEKWESNFFK